jgi:uncharacterized surface protein with fasciclin (FAS1) repeats
MSTTSPKFPHLFGRRSLLLLSLFTAALMSAACVSITKPTSVADTVASDAQLSTLSRLIASAGLSDTLKSAGAFTLFAPSNEAFSALPAKTMDELSKDPAKLKAVLSYHVLPGKIMSSDVVQGNAKTVNGAAVALAKAGNFTTIEDAMVTKADAAASNGVVHTIDRVLMPPVAK